MIDLRGDKYSLSSDYDPKEGLKIQINEIIDDFGGNRLVLEVLLNDRQARMIVPPSYEERLRKLLNITPLSPDEHSYLQAHKGIDYIFRALKHIKEENDELIDTLDFTANHVSASYVGSCLIEYALYGLAEGNPSAIKMLQECTCFSVNPYCREKTAAGDSDGNGAY